MKSASFKAIEPHIGKFFKNKLELHSFINRLRQQSPYKIPKNSLLLLFKIEDVGEFLPELPNQVVCYFLLGKQEFILEVSHGIEFFEIFELVESG